MNQIYNNHGIRTRKDSHQWLSFYSLAAIAAYTSTPLSFHPWPNKPTVHQSISPPRWSATDQKRLWSVLCPDTFVPDHLDRLTWTPSVICAPRHRAWPNRECFNNTDIGQSRSHQYHHKLPLGQPQGGSTARETADNSVGVCPRRRMWK